MAVPTIVTTRDIRGRESTDWETSNVDTVIADGRILRRAAEFTALNHAEVLAQAAESAAALRARADWA